MSGVPGLLGCPQSLVGSSVGVRDSCKARMYDLGANDSGLSHLRQVELHSSGIPFERKSFKSAIKQDVVAVPADSSRLDLSARFTGPRGGDLLCG